MASLGAALLAIRVTLSSASYLQIILFAYKVNSYF